jgi:hypothetical protein
MDNSVEDIVLMIVDTYVQHKTSDEWSGESFKEFSDAYIEDQVNAEEIDADDVERIKEELDVEEYYTDEYWDDRRYIDTADVGMDDTF